MINEITPEKFEDFFMNKESSINPYYEQYKSHELNYEVENSKIKIEFTKYGLVELKIASLDQSSR